MVMTMPHQTFFILTQGCKVNQYESQSIREAWTDHGMHECENSGSADIILINTCAVTKRAISDLKRHVRKIHENNPGGAIILAGCAVQALPDLARLNGVRLAVSQEDKHLLRNHTGLTSIPVPHADTISHPFPNFSISGYKRTRGVIKIQDGCSHGCTYCIIPTTRGRSVSRKPQDILDEIERLFLAGVYEVSLCGINLRHFGRDLHPTTDLWELLETIEKRFGPTWRSRARIRLSSLEPSELTDKGLKILEGASLVCPHLHISLQSGSSHILRSMGRGHYSPKMVLYFVDRLRKIWPVFALGADIITGFPGETSEYFRETLACVRRLPLTYAHVFPYSERPGTPAASFGDQVSHRERTTRAAAIRAVVAEKRQDFIQSLEDSTLEVIFEDGIKGMSQFYVPCLLTTPGLVSPTDPSLHRVTPVSQDAQGLFVTLCEATRHGEVK